METIYSGIKKPDRVLAISNALRDGAPLDQVCQQFNVRKKTALSYQDIASAMQSHEIALTDGHCHIPLARIVVAGGGLTAASLVAMRRFKTFFSTLELPCWKLTNGIDSVSLHELKHPTQEDRK